MQATEERTTYNGWKNYETWATNLWMDNDQGSQEYWRECARIAYEEAHEDKIWNKRERAIYNLADCIKSEHEEAVPEAVDGTVYADLMMAALSEVSWDEIAEHLIDAVIEEVGEA